MTAKVMHPARAELDQLIPGGVTDGDWSYLERLSFVAEYESGAYDLSHLANEIEQFRADAALIRRPRVRELAAPVIESSRDEHYEALSFLLAKDAAEDGTVRAFRHKVLGDKLLTFAEVERWVKKSAGPPTKWVTTPIAGGERGKGTLNATARVLRYAVPGSDVVRVQVTTAGGVLEGLRVLSESLAKRYGWQDAQATLFVLTGLIPLMEAVRARVEMRFPIKVASRVILEVDPTVSPQEMAHRWREIRKGVISGRFRRMGPKHIRLALFLAEHPEGTWEERRQAWNEAYPKWSYGHRSNFTRDAISAQQRLLEPPLNP